MPDEKPNKWLELCPEPRPWPQPELSFDMPSRTSPFRWILFKEMTNQFHITGIG